MKTNILLVGKHRLMSRFIESHILYCQEPLAQVTIATPWQLREITGMYDLIILNNISLQYNPDQAVASLAPYPPGIRRGRYGRLLPPRCGKVRGVHRSGGD